MQHVNTQQKIVAFKTDFGTSFTCILTFKSRPQDCVV